MQPGARQTGGVGRAKLWISWSRRRGAVRTRRACLRFRPPVIDRLLRLGETLPSAPVAEARTPQPPRGRGTEQHGERITHSR